MNGWIRRSQVFENQGKGGGVFKQFDSPRQRRTTQGERKLLWPEFVVTAHNKLWRHRWELGLVWFRFYPKCKGKAFRRGSGRVICICKQYHPDNWRMDGRRANREQREQLGGCVRWRRFGPWWWLRKWRVANDLGDVLEADLRGLIKNWCAYEQREEPGPKWWKCHISRWKRLG